jgi:hypothetical protein
MIKTTKAHGKEANRLNFGPKINYILLGELETKKSRRI